MQGTDITYDIAIIGGGINGCGIARDAAGRGLRVLLLERGDLAQGTSSASTKLIHGGLRYLEHYEFSLVREALAEREVLWGIAPHIIWPLRFILPHRRGLRPRWLLRLGLFVYDHLGARLFRRGLRRGRLPGAQSIRLAGNPAGAALQPQYTHGFAYSDGWVDDARLVVLNARDAAARGATIRTRCGVTGLARVPGLLPMTGQTGDATSPESQWQIEAGGERFHARAIINAAGPQVMQLLATAALPSDLGLRLVRGSHIVVKRLYEGPHAYFFQLGDGRIFFAIPYEQHFTLIGTTDVDQSESDGPPRISEAEIAYLCAGVSEYFRTPVTPADVVWSYSGIRPLVEDGSGRPEAATRGYRFEVDRGPKEDEPPLLSVHGGKITTYRTLAEAALARLARATPALAPLLDGPSWTGTAPLPGGDFTPDPVAGDALKGGDAQAANLATLEATIAAAAPQLAPATIHRLARSYGTQALIFAGPAMGRDLGHGLHEAELHHLITREWAQTAEDILWRRSKLGLVFSDHEKAALAQWLAHTHHAKKWEPVFGSHDA